VIRYLLYQSWPAGNSVNNNRQCIVICYLSVLTSGE
jgi:hypothetical protein